MAVNVKTKPPVEPVTLAEARSQCRLVASGSPPEHPDDAFLERVIQASRENAESITQRTFIETEFEWSFDSFPDNDDELVLPRDPVLSVESIEYTDENGDSQTLTGFTTQFTESKSIIVPAFNSEWPDARGHLGDVKVTFKAGYQPTADSPPDYVANVPNSIKSAILLMTSHLYEHRSAVVTGVAVNEVKLAYKSLLWPHRLIGI